MLPADSPSPGLRLFSPDGACPAATLELSLGDVIILYLAFLGRRRDAGDYSQGAIDRQARYLRSFNKAAGAIAVKEAKQHVFSEWWLAGCERWKSDYSRRDAKDAVLGCFRWAEDEDRIERCPFRKPRFRLVCTPREPFRWEDFSLLMWEATTCTKRRPERLDLLPYRRRRRHGSLALREAIVFLMYTGCRPCEMRETEWRDLDWLAGAVTLFAHKTARQTGQARVIGVPAKVLRLLAKVRRRRSPRASDKIFLNQAGTPWDKDAFCRHFRRHADRAGLAKNLTGYCLRHGFITQALERGLDGLDIAAQVGHRTTRMIGHYSKRTRRNAARLRQIAEKATER